mmetsp:Transcript_126309/g.315780  ORF Transcript_126309/g.315780 Transcript_126309/m.315780 type:complete len:239 (+) Transcript_126309:439-1155(+)
MPKACKFTKRPEPSKEGHATFASMQTGHGRPSRSSSSASSSVISTPSDGNAREPSATVAGGGSGMQGNATARERSEKSRYCEGSPGTATSHNGINSPGSPVAVTTARTTTSRPFTSSESRKRKRMRSPELMLARTSSASSSRQPSAAHLSSSTSLASLPLLWRPGRWEEDRSNSCTRISRRSNNSMASSNWASAASPRPPPSISTPPPAAVPAAAEARLSRSLAIASRDHSSSDGRIP